MPGMSDQPGRQSMAVVRRHHRRCDGVVDGESLQLGSQATRSRVRSIAGGGALKMEGERGEASVIMQHTQRALKVRALV